MAPPGIAPLLQKHCRPTVLSFRPGEGSTRPANVLLVDAQSVGAALLTQLGTDSDGEAAAAQLYQAALRFYAGLAATGLTLVVVVDDAAAAGGGGPAWAAGALNTAYAQLGLTVERAKAGAGRQLLLAWYHANRDSVLGVVSDDDAMYVLGVPAVAHPEELVVDGVSGGATLHMWDTTLAWAAWQAAGASALLRGMQISLMQRAQVAAVLGHASAASAAAGGAPRTYGFCPNMAAQQLLSRGGIQLPLDFFTSPPLSIHSFGADDLQRFNDAVAQYMAADKAARAEGALDAARSEAPPPAPVSALVTALDGPQAAAAAEAARQAAAEKAAVAGAQGMTIDVGSGLTKHDWEDIDAKEVVAKVRSSTGYMLMTRIQAWDPTSAASAGAAGMPVDRLFQLFFVLANQETGAAKVWEALAKACFPTQWAAATTGEKSAIKSRRKELLSVKEDALMADLKSTAVMAVLWVNRLQAFLKGKAAPSLLAVRRDGAVAGPGTQQWAAATECWGAVTPDVKKAALTEMWANHNSSALNHGGPPMRYPHQQALLDMVGEHLSEVQKAVEARDVARRFGEAAVAKTFTAVMMNLHLLRPKPEASSGPQPVSHPDVIILYSVPTKQVLKRVGQECEAHGVVYWTAAKDNDVYSVRRPYSIRTKRGEKGGTGVGPMKDQLDKCEGQGREHHDQGGGRPAFIVSDIYSTAAILRVAAKADPDDFYHHTKILLYFDEPNMGIHLDAGLRSIVKDIMAHAPATAILASATLPTWDRLPAWWKGDCRPATRTVITQEPYTLPMSSLQVLSTEGPGVPADAPQATPVSVLQLFPGHATFSAALRSSPRLCVLLLRHLSPAQANALLLRGDDWGEAERVEADGWVVAGQDVRSLREAVEPVLKSMPEEQYATLRASWSEWSRPVPGGLRGVISSKGVTMIATKDSRTLALELAGRPLVGSKDARAEIAWGDAKAEIRAKVSAAKAAAAQQAKDSRRTQKKTDDDAKPGSTGGEAAVVVTLRTGLWVTPEEAGETEDDVLVMLSKGIAYATAEGTEPLVKRLYQQALLYIPESKVQLPPIHVLAVDYSSIYGTDCAAVDTIVMCEDLGKVLSWEDHQQFIGRLRRDGTAIYPSLAMLRYATTGVVGTADDAEVLRVRATRAQHMAAAQAMVASAAAAPAGADSTEALVNELRAQRKEGGFLEILSRADAASAVLTSVLRSVLAECPEAVAGGRAPLLKAVAARLKQWGPIRPVAMVKLAAPRDQTELVCALEALCLETVVAAAAPSADGDDGAEAAQAAPGPSPYLPIAQNLLKWLYDNDALGEDGVLAWHASKPQPGVKPEFRKAVQPFVEWLQEAEDDDDDEDDE
ncbi:hypothetical protein FOA52_001476 [Chlamydomonas sp. UWO 241]|nr:hypothetical protein FOA52_001476 [Chlamydomonas sp. UWO 241]